MSIHHLSAAQLVSLSGGAIAAGLGCGFLTRNLMEIAYRPIPHEAQAWQFEQRRRIVLRQRSRLYRWCEPFLLGVEHVLSRLLAGKAPWLVKSLAKQINRGGHELPFEPLEFLAYSIFQGIAAGLLLFPLWSLHMSLELSLFSSLCIVAMVVGVAIRELVEASNKRLCAFKKQLPFCVDLIALMMAAGAELRVCLEAVVANSFGSPVQEEFARVLQKTSANQPLGLCLQDLRDRMQDRDISDFVTTVVSGERNGTPLSETFLHLSDQLRLRQTQQAEKRSGQIQTMMTFPQFILMLACLIIVVAPTAITMWKELPF